MEHAGKTNGDEMTETQERDFGIGTPATRAATIEKIIEKEMVIRKGRALIPTEYGIRLIEILPDFLRSPEMTGDWEARLSRMSRGEEDAERFMGDIRTLTTKLVESAAEQGDSKLSDSNVIGTCPLCGNKVREYPDSYYCDNKECGFRRIWKAKKGFHPTLKSDTMRKLLDEGRAETEKGVYSIIKTEPFISFERSDKPEPQFDSLLKLISDYGMEPVNKVPNGGALWFEGKRGDEKMEDFVSDCNAIGCLLQYSKDAKALKHKSGWYLIVEPQYVESFLNTLRQDDSKCGEPADAPDREDIALDLVKEYGFEYIDKRDKKGGLWIIANEEDAKEFVEKCKSKGIIWSFAPNGSRSTKHKPGWFIR